MFLGHWEFSLTSYMVVPSYMNHRL